jgi:hypothetical protein
VNVNAFIAPLRPDFATRLDPALTVARSAHDTGLPNGCAERVLANHFPIQHNQLVADQGGTRVGIAELAAEIVRLLRSGGRLHFSCSACDRPALAAAFASAGLVDVVLQPNGYIDATKP